MHTTLDIDDGVLTAARDIVRRRLLTLYRAVPLAAVAGAGVEHLVSLGRSRPSGPEPIPSRRPPRAASTE